MLPAVVFAVFVASYALGSNAARQHVQEAFTSESPLPRIAIPREHPLSVGPLYDDPELVSDEQLAAVLRKVRPKFPPEQLKPNFVEHALRTWGLAARFEDPAVMSGEQLKDFLVDHGRYLASWGDTTKPLLEDRADGVAVRWGKETGASVHHDHWLASLTEAGISLHEPVFTPQRRDRTIHAVLQAALCDFDLDEREVEWSAMAFGLWLPPQTTWTTRDGRELSFDLIARRLMRGDRNLGVCCGTHRVYSLMLLVRLDDEHDILSDPVRAEAWAWLEQVRDQLIASQFEDGHWPSNWPEGRQAVEHPVNDPRHKQVIATGHHLEWLAIAPKELHPPRERIHKAAEWVIRTTLEQSESDILERYTFFTHVGNALALWRNTRPSVFWQQWEAAHPWTRVGQAF